MNKHFKQRINIVFILVIVHVFFFTWLRFSGGVFKIINSILLLISVFYLIHDFIKKILNIKVNLSFFRLPYFLLIVWSLFTILRSLSSDLHDWLVIFGNYNLGMGAWLVPLALVFGFNFNIWKSLLNFFKAITRLSILLLPLYFLLSPNFSLASISTLFFALPLLILTLPFTKKKKRWLIILATLVYIYMAWKTGYRTAWLVVILTVLFTIIEYIRSKDSKLKYKTMLIGLFSTLTVFAFIYIKNMADDRSNNEEIVQDTRSFLIDDLLDDMTFSERLIGRGTLGTYHSKTFAQLEEYNLGIGSSDRGGVEIGWLNVLLKGGYIMVALFIIILLPISILGITKSNNWFTKSLGYYILLILVLMIIGYPQVYDASFLLLWLSAGTVLDKRVRKLTNIECISYLNKHDFITK